MGWAQCRRRADLGLVDNVSRQIADEVEMAKAPLGHRLAFERLDRRGVGLALGDQLLKPGFVDGREAAGQGGLGDGLGHGAFSNSLPVD